ncbi:Pr6Pr family membrane protein [Quadrisphaera oryzae]|uniref:Pr6Pr family membrane protein n=1 Tax=Quadrisphaera TaxID=317661 RepID=UPI0016496DDC|nr:Pr6Pr family membrane protein [Quadrisphaera sp. RL12-1S]
MFRVCHAVIAALVVVALVVDVSVTVAGGPGFVAVDGSPLGLAGRLANLFSYFTILSNVLVLATSALFALRSEPSGALFRVLHLDALLSIVATGVVYAVLLAATEHPTGWSVVSNTIFHDVVPVAFPLAWLVFGPRPRLTWRLVALAFAWPVAWLVYTFVRGALTGWYPYGFLDATQLGFWGALLGALQVFVSAVVLAVVVKLLDSRLPALARSSSRPTAH